MPFDAEQAAEDLMSEIEGKFPPNRCSLQEYHDMLKDLWHRISERMNEVRHEIGDDFIGED